MNEIFKKTLLYDFYGELLTDNQKMIYGYYHLDDLSLGEISEQMNISRQGVFDTLKRCEHQLKHFEDKLHLVQKFVDNNTRVQEIYDIASGIQSQTSIEDVLIQQALIKIEGLSKNILEDL